jgi:hypothetical protein
VLDGEGRSEANQIQDACEKESGKQMKSSGKSDEATPQKDAKLLGITFKTLFPSFGI